MVPASSSSTSTSMSHPPQRPSFTAVQTADTAPPWVAGYNIPATGFFSYPGPPQYPGSGTAPRYTFMYHRNGGDWQTNNSAPSNPTTSPSAQPTMSAIASSHPESNNAFRHSWQFAQMPHQPHPQLRDPTSSQVQGASTRNSLSSSQSPSQSPPQSLPQQSPPPPLSDSTTPSILTPLLTTLSALQTQLSSVQTDVQAAASEIRTVRNAQKRMGERIGVLEGVFGVSKKKAGTKGKGRANVKGRGRGKGKNNEVESELEPEAEESDAGPASTCAIPDRLAAIEFAVEELLDRAGNRPSKTLLRDAATSPPPKPFAPSLQIPLSLQTETAHSPSLSPFAQCLTSTSSPSPVAAPIALPAAPEKKYSDASVDAYPPPSPQSECSISYRGGPGRGFAPVDWTSVPSTHERYSAHSGQSAYAVQYLTHFSRSHQLRDVGLELDDSSSSFDAAVSSRQVTSPTSEPSTIGVPAPQPSTQSADTQGVDVTMREDTAEPSAPRSQPQETPRTGNMGEEAVVTSSQSQHPRTKGSISIPMLCIGPSTDICSLQNTSSDAIPFETSTLHSARLPPVLVNIPMTSEDPFALQAFPSPPTTASPDTPWEKGYPDRSGPLKLGNGPASPTIGTDQHASVPPSETRPCESLPSEPARESELPAETTPPPEVLPRSSMMATPPSLTPPPTDPRRNVLNVEHPRDQIEQSPLSRLQSRMRPFVTPPPPSPSPHTSRKIGDRLVEKATDGDVHMDVDVDVDSLQDDGLGTGSDNSNPEASVNALEMLGGGEDVDVNLNPNVMSKGTTATLSEASAAPSSVGAPESADSNHTEAPTSQQQTTQVPCPDRRPSTSPATEPCSLPPPSTSHQSSPPPSNHVLSPEMNLMRDPTPTDSQGLSQEEEDVWQALMLTTPVASLPVPFDDASRSPLGLHEAVQDFPHPQEHGQHQVGEPSSSSSTLLHVNASEVLGVPPESASLDAGCLRSRTLSPLTSLHSDSGEEKSLGDDEQLASYLSRSKGRRQSKRVEESSDLVAVGTSERYSEPRPFPPQSATSSPRAASEKSVSARGGPTASLEELAQLARRDPLKIYIKVPPFLRGLKRKWRGVEDDELMDAQEPLATNETYQGGDAIITEDDGIQGNEAQTVGESVTTLPPSAIADALTAHSSSSTLCASPTHQASISAVVSATSTLATVEDSVSNPAPPTKRPKVKKADATKKKKVRGRPPKSQRRSDMKLRSEDIPRYFVTGGEVVRASGDGAERSAFQSAPAVPRPNAEQVSNEGKLAEETRRTNKGKRGPSATNHAMKSPSTKMVGSRAQKSTLNNASPSTGKEETHTLPSVGEGTWPDLSKTFNKDDLQQFIQCDNCDMWYHYGCVGVESGDPRLESDTFICPLCCVQTAKRHTPRGRPNDCARPDCPETNESSSDVYVVARLVGRQRLGRAGCRWLVEWEGYPMSQASWIPEGNVIGDGKKLFESFQANALAQGLNLKQDIVILEDAVSAGWAEPCDDEVHYV